MRKKKTLNGMMLLLVVFAIIAINWDGIKTYLGSGGMTGKASWNEMPEEINASHYVYFCPEDNCARELIEWIDLAQKKIHCAFYDVDLDEVKEALIKKKNEGVDVEVVTDSDNKEVWDGEEFVKEDNRSALMHNKFCVIDNQLVWTGSFNPTHRGNEKNNNNAVVYQSQLLAKNYEEEFQELWKGEFGKGKPGNNPSIIIDGKLIENYFCPEDFCANKVIKTIREAQKNIYFMTFSFTHDGIGDELVKADNRGVKIEGVFEKSQNNKYTEKKKLDEAGIKTRWDGNKANMHNKVFIIDNKTVITGSFNPTRNGDERNDENILIIHDPDVASKFLKEFNQVWNEAAGSS